MRVAKAWEAKRVFQSLHSRKPVLERRSNAENAEMHTGKRRVPGSAREKHLALAQRAGFKVPAQTALTAPNHIWYAYVSSSSGVTVRIKMYLVLLFPSLAVHNNSTVYTYMYKG